MSFRDAILLSKQGRAPVLEDAAVHVPERGIFVVADGFGGGTPGVEAAKLACESVREFLETEAGDLEATLPFVLRRYFSLAGNVVFNAILHANRKLVERNRKEGADHGGASVAAVFADGDLLAIANSGACSARVIRKGESRSLVRPRTLQGFSDPFSKPSVQEPLVPLTGLGLTEDLEPEIVETRLQAGDWVLIHTGVMPNELMKEIESINQKNLDIRAVAESIKGQIEGISFGSNFTVLLTKFV
jgi:serine/threonine protein phosphatase PrpC